MWFPRWRRCAASRCALGKAYQRHLKRSTDAAGSSVRSTRANRASGRGLGVPRACSAHYLVLAFASPHPKLRGRQWPATLMPLSTSCALWPRPISCWAPRSCRSCTFRPPALLDGYEGDSGSRQSPCKSLHCEASVLCSRENEVLIVSQASAKRSPYHPKEKSWTCTCILPAA